MNGTTTPTIIIVETQPVNDEIDDVDDVEAGAAFVHAAEATSGVSLLMRASRWAIRLVRSEDDVRDISRN